MREETDLMRESYEKNIVLALAVSLAGCAGRDPQLELISKPNDSRLSCRQIKAEQTTLLNKMQMASSGKSDSNIHNVVAGAAGLIFIPAWVFLDLKGADAKELRSQQARHNQLVSIAESKGC